jgi:2Fe-2S ferredoxin
MAIVRLKALGREWVHEVSLGTSLLEAAEECGAPEGSACGGVCGCSTCHVYVVQGAELLSPAEEKEEDIMDKAFDVRMSSRLGCQARVMKEGEVVVEITRESLDAFYNEHPDEIDPRDAGTST